MPDPDYLADFYQEVRDLYDNNYRSKELQDRFIKAGKNQACIIISKDKPRINQRANISIAANDTSIEMPSNFYNCYLAAAYKLKYGKALTDSASQNLLINPYDKKTYAIGGNSRFTPEGRIIARRRVASGLSIGGWPSLSGYDSFDSDDDTGISLEFFQNDNKGWSLWFDQDQSVAARTENGFSYTAIHEITASKDTVTNDIRDKFLYICLREACLEAQRQLAKEAQSSSDIQKANIFGEQARFYDSQLFSLGSMGSAD